MNNYARLIGKKKKQPARCQNSTNRDVGGGNTTDGVACAGANEKASQRARVVVPEVRRVWGTKKDASTTVVLHTVRQLTKLDSNKRLSVKRFYEGEPGRRDRWWFLL